MVDPVTGAVTTVTAQPSQSAAEARTLGLTRTGGVFVGQIGGSLIKVPRVFTQRGSGKRRLPKPNLIGGKKLWIGGDDVGGFVIGPPRSGKGASLIVPNCLLWPDSIVVLDMRRRSDNARSSRACCASRRPTRTATRNAIIRSTSSPSPPTSATSISIPSRQPFCPPRRVTLTGFPGRALFAGVTSWVLENLT
ncbi:type IV secretory system conjugative DNA transfer family protein (plasmid) [Sinorhizobium chiapasense]|uniref:Type IV secretory system conjugative DNA transfer family protein n=1 Tax=Sinorhizobium chiapasense TaxID=501572 RepID=A0ABZ2BFY6_9HYPH